MRAICNKNCEPNSDILFYILVPVYKAERYIRTCIESVLNQTYQNFMLILADDGSPDGSGEICDEFAALSPQIIAIHQQNQGALAARQAALRVALRDAVDRDNLEQKYIVYLDSDDTLKHYALERIRAAIQMHSCDMVIYRLDSIQKESAACKPKSPNLDGFLVEDKRQLYRIIFNNVAYNSLCRKAISFELVQDLDYSKDYGIVHGEDLLESIPYLQRSKRVFFLNESLYNYAENPNSVTHTVNENNFKLNFDVRERVNGFLKSENVFTEEDWIEYRSYCIWLLCFIVNKILSLRTSTARKMSLMNDIRSSNYYKEFIFRRRFDKTKLTTKDIVYFKLFTHRLDRLLIYGYKAYQTIKSIKCKRKRYEKG